MAFRQPGTQRQDELIEYPYVGPFGGIQSEVQLDQIGRTGFQEVQNIMFRKAQARTMPGFQSLQSPDGSKILGIGSFFDKNGDYHFVVWTFTDMFNWNFDFNTLTGTWQLITNPGVGLSNGPAFVAWDVVGYKLYFTQLAAPVEASGRSIGMWDGLTPGWSWVPVVPNSGAIPEPARYLCELGFHLLEADTNEVDGHAKNRIKWSSIGDGSDWSDPPLGGTAGQEDLFNNLGPINGLARIYQTGYAFQQWGITQIIPTGIGTAPFEFVSMGSKAKGCVMHYALASFGEIVACYPGKNDIYLFDGTESQPIGSRPIDGNRRLGARTRILQDLFSASWDDLFGYILTSANQHDYESYWMLIPVLNKAWVYHFDEGTWTQELFPPGQLYGPVGTAPLGHVVLQGLGNFNSMDTMAISDGLANSVAAFDFDIPNTAPTINSINNPEAWSGMTGMWKQMGTTTWNDLANSTGVSGTEWVNMTGAWNAQGSATWDSFGTAGDGFYIKSGMLHFEDQRHYHTMKKMRLLLQDFEPITISLRFTNEKGQVDGPKKLTYGTGSGQTLTRVVSVALPGNYLTWELSGPQGVRFGMTEITPIIDIAGEIQMGVR